MGLAPYWPKQICLFYFLFNGGKLRINFLSLLFLSVQFSGVKVCSYCCAANLQNSFHLAKLKLISH